MTDRRGELAASYGEKTLRALDHILGFAEEIAEIVAEGEVRFLETRRSQRAAEAVLERIGEAVNRLPKSFLEEFPDQPWRSIVGMRNLAIHEYDVVDYAVVWNAMQRRVPELGEYIIELLDVERPGGRTMEP